MSEFLAYFELGFDHITDSKGYDHILFIIALCAIYTIKDWKKVLILVTAFTLGHSITLILATTQVIQVRSDIIEFLIPITILITAMLNFTNKSTRSYNSKFTDSSSTYRYPIALGFGLIHGLGFSNYLVTLLGKETQLLGPLLGFNVGLEVGQLIIISIFLLISFVALEVLKVAKITWNHILSGIIAGMAISLIINSDFLQG
jgi:hypothetical protein